MIKKHSTAQQSTKEPSTEQDRIFCSKGSTVLSNQLHFNITTETQSLVSLLSLRLSLGLSVICCRSRLPPHYLDARPTLCQGCVNIMSNTPTLFACWQIAFYWAWNHLTRQRKWRGVKEGWLRERWRWKRIGRYREIERERKRQGIRKLVGAASPVS